MTSFIHVIRDTIAGTLNFRQSQATLPVERVPYVLHEPAILSGYRVLHRPWSYYVRSLVHVHNETVNVWSHILGCALLLHRLYGYYNADDCQDGHVLETMLMFGITCIIGLSTSAAVHLLHSKSSYIHFVAFMTDYIGASVCAFGSGVAGIYGFSTAAVYHVLEPFYVPLLFASSYLNFVNLCVAKIWYGHDPHNLNRKYMFIIGMGLQAIINAAPFLPRYVTCYKESECSLSSMNYFTVIQAVFVLEAVAFAAHQPEKTWPGRFDIVGHGHQIFHMLIVVNHVVQLDAIYNDHLHRVTSHVSPNVRTVMWTLAALCAAEAVTLVFLTRYVPTCLRRVTRAVAKEEHAAEYAASHAKST